MQIMKNIYMVLGGPYANIANIYVIKGDNSLVIVDTAETLDEYETILRNIRYWGLDEYPVSHVLISHKHKNHIGNAWRFREKGAKIVAGRYDAEAIEKGIINDICDYANFPLKDEYIPCQVDMKVKDGDVFTAAGIEFEVFETPGHTDGSVFYRFTMEGKDIWLTGDVLNIQDDCRHAYLGWEGGVDFDRSLFFESVKRFSKFRGDIILPGHYQLCMQNATKIFNDSYRIPFEEWRKPAVSEE